MMIDVTQSWQTLLHETPRTPEYPCYWMYISMNSASFKRYIIVRLSGTLYFVKDVTLPHDATALVND